MYTNKKILIASLLVASTSFTTLASADGFLSSLLGGSSKAGADFKSMLSHVPSDTSYLLTNKKPIPKEVMDFHLARSQKLISMISDMDKSKGASKDGPDAFFKALFEDLGKKVSEGKIEDSGLSLKARYLIYGFDTNPVLRLSFADKEKIMETLKRAEKKSGQKADLVKCGDYDCFIQSDEKNDKSVAVVILDNQIAAAAFTTANKGKMIDHLIGKSDPKESYSEKSWDAFLKENGYQGFGEGFVSLTNLYTKNDDLILDEINSNAKDKLNPKDAEACMKVAQDHLKNVPKIIFGTKNIEAKKMDYEIVVRTSSSVSDVLQTIANKKNIAQHTEASIMDFGVNIDFKKLRDALTQYSNFLIASGEKHKCPAIKKKDIRKSMGGMAMAMNMGFSQFNSIYASVVDVELDKSMSPKKVDAYISLGADDPAGLLGMLGMFSPPLMGFKVPKDGSVVKLPEGAIPSRGLPVPDVFLSRTSDTLNILIGNDKPKLKAYKSDKAELFTSSMNGKRYYEKFSQIMKAIPQGKADDQEQASKMMEAMGEMSGNIQQEVTADKRGLVINYHVQY